MPEREYHLMELFKRRDARGGLRGVGSGVLRKRRGVNKEECGDGEQWGLQRGHDGSPGG
jgi:hypothetical protein